jgi:hypothetical protein
MVRRSILEIIKEKKEKKQAILSPSSNTVATWPNIGVGSCRVCIDRGKSKDKKENSDVGYCDHVMI